MSEHQYTTDPETGDLMYEDPASKTQFIWDKAKNSWKPRVDGGKDYDFDGETYLHTDSQGNKHKWDLEAKQWVKISVEETAKAAPEEEESEEESEEDDNTTDEQRKARMYRKRKAQPGFGLEEKSYFTDPESGMKLYKDPNDGMTYEWDESKKAWFPRINEDFLAQYQMNYGFTKDGIAEPTKPEEPKGETSADQGKVEAKKAKSTQQQQEKAQWFEEDSQKSRKVYVSGLPDGKPEDWDEDAFAKYMSKCGVVDIDVRTNQPKVKLYKDHDGSFKGDGLCTYVKVESVELALTIIDGASINPGQVIKVERAKFELKGDYDPKLKPKKLSKKELERKMKRKEKMLAWEPDKLRGERSKKDKVVVIENVFDPRDFDENAAMILECSQRLRDHCSKMGSVKKVVVYDKHPQGVCQVFFGSPEEADSAIPMLDGRLFSKHKVPMKAYTWDGKTKYKINETEEEEKERLANWEKFLKDSEKEEHDNE